MGGQQSGEDELHESYELHNGKRMVHTMVSLYADDQLRQRVAWALSQVRHGDRRDGARVL